MTIKVIKFKKLTTGAKNSKLHSIRMERLTLENLALEECQTLPSIKTKKGEKDT